ncbi:MAG: S-layer homology domain-containing protein [Synergistaceae bacterium]|jgi:hypothetical protein|nr:S-layer homology domain-containing protein [Synergistaceae bacterium]
MKRFAIVAAAVILVALTVPSFAATNPFMDVPASHWAYDAISRLASNGVILGYPDGFFKGAQPATRYEMASMIARLLAKVDLDKASKQDVETMRRLVIEFRDELDALGVRVDSLDERVAILEEDIGGWNMAGHLNFDANFGTGDTDYYPHIAGKNHFDLNRYRFWINRRINETTTFMARLGSNGNATRGVIWDYYEVTTKLPYDISLTVGHSNFDWEADLNFYTASNAIFGDIDANMFKFKRDWGLTHLELVVARQTANDAAGLPSLAENLPGDLENFLIAGLANFDISERLRGGLMLYYWMTDEEIDNPAPARDSDTDLYTLGAFFGFNFTPDIELKGMYYHQGLGDDWQARVRNPDDSASAWKIILDVKQEALKFTSVWLEYANIDNNFAKQTPPTYRAITLGGADILGNKPYRDNENTTKVYGITARQRWNDTWRTFLHFSMADYDTAGIDDATNWAVSVAYRINPAVEFELMYDNIDYGGFTDAAGNLVNGGPGRVGDDHIIRLRTFIAF